MPRLTQTTVIKHQADDLYELVRDIRRYPEFIKWINSMSVRQEEATTDHYSCIGEVAVGFKGFQETFSTRVSANPAKRRIDVELDRGPFRHLRNRWQFDVKSRGVTDVFFFIDYEFKNPLLRLLARTNQSLAVNRIMQAFQSEADRRYGQTS
ncbi:MAG: hypothetical protein CME93_07110 [Hyphomonadaceae bacterium]|nr:hypothetical protein [Hyphomonadaceae bacterium]OUX93711.1 MAG: hypothetical protein CBB77_08585 [Hyphomonas sp. TMED17]CAI8369764.1 MAG: Persistence and stress-resistance toxin PasT [Hyphomonas sp. TMED17]